MFASDFRRFTGILYAYLNFDYSFNISTEQTSDWRRIKCCDRKYSCICRSAVTILSFKAWNYFVTYP